MPKFRIRFHEQVYIDLCVEAPSRNAVTLWTEDRDGTFADATAEHLTEQNVVARYVDVLAPWEEGDGDPGIVYEVDAVGKQVGRIEK